MVAALAGCPPAHAVSADAASGAVDAASGDDGGPRVVLGTTTVDGQGFSAFSSDQILVAGAQGGFHVWLKLRVRGVAPGPLRVRSTAVRASDRHPLYSADRTLEIGSATDGSWEQPSPLAVLLCPTPSGVAVVDQAIDLEVALSDPAGLSAGAVFRAHCPDDAHAACVALCSG